jgi:murein L,D-transpeptidase YcbB/YkuD
MTVAVTLLALFSAFQWGDLTAVPTGVSPAGQSAPTTPASESLAATIDDTRPTGSVSAIEQSVVPDPLASLDPADRVVAEKIRDLLAAKSVAIFPSKSERMAVESFYQNRTLAPLWLERGVANARATAVIARLKDADADGLDVSEYCTPNFAGLGPDALAEADLKLPATVLTFARHLQAGRFPYKRVSPNNIQLPQAPPEPAAILAKIVSAADARKALDEFSPPHEAYQKLKVKLAEMRAKSAGARPEVGDGPGNLDGRTVKELNGPIRDKQIDLVIANMERWRWYPRDLGATNVIVNQPDFTLKVMHDGSQIWTTRVVIGAPRPGC